MGDVTPKFKSDRYTFLKSQLEIDMLQMDSELSRIPVLVQEASEIAAQASEIRDSLRDYFNLTAAQVSDKLRREILPSGKPRSEERISSENILDPEYQKARDEYAESRLDAALWETVVIGIQTKDRHLHTSSANLLAGFISTDYILEKRRTEMRAATPPSNRPALRNT